MNDFNDPYGILALNAMKDLTEEFDPTDENPLMQWLEIPLLSNRLTSFYSDEL